MRRGAKRRATREGGAVKPKARRAGPRRRAGSSGTEPPGRGAAWGEERRLRRGAKRGATREGGAVKREGEAGGAPEASRELRSEPPGRGAAWGEERRLRRGAKRGATREGGAVKREGEAGGAPEASRELRSEPPGRGAAWTEERGATREGGASRAPRRRAGSTAHNLASMDSSPLLAAPGAVPADGPDAGVAAHYGDPYAEQRALTGALGLVDRSHRGVIRVAGQDRLSWLHSITTQDVEHLAPGSTAEALILSPNGHVEHHLTLTDDGTQVWAHVEPGTAGALLEFLESMRFMMRVEPADVSADYAVLTVMGPDSAAADTADWLTSTGHTSTHSFGIDVLIPRKRLAEAAAELQEHGAVLAGTWAYEALRIAARRPRFGLDTDHRTIPHEVGWIGTAVHLTKGCYRGQETVARVHNLGHPPRRLVFLHLDGSEDRLPAHGDAVSLDAADVGFVGSAARHYELGPIAMALVKRTTPVDAALLAAGLPRRRRSSCRRTPGRTSP